MIRPEQPAPCTLLLITLPPECRYDCYDASLPCNSGTTPLHLAAMKVCEGGGGYCYDASLACNSGTTPLHLAAMKVSEGGGGVLL